jgi:hypothetical protein
LDIEVVGAGRYDESEPLNLGADLEDPTSASSNSGTEAEADVPAELAQVAEPIPVIQSTPLNIIFNSAPASTQNPQH